MLLRIQEFYAKNKGNREVTQHILLIEYIQDDIIDLEFISDIARQYDMEVPLEYDTSKIGLRGRVTPSGLLL